MNVDQDIAILRNRLEDIDTVNPKYSTIMLVDALNIGQVTITERLHILYLTELTNIKSGVTAVSGQYSISSITGPKVARGDQGILAVKINGGKWCKRMDPYELSVLENEYLTGNTRNPRYWVDQNIIYIRPTVIGGTDPVIDIHYIGVPTDLVYPWNVQTAAGGTSNTQMKITAGQGQGGAGTYVWYPIYYEDATSASYHIITANDGTDITVTPAKAVGDFGTGTIKFLNRSEDTLNNELVNGDLNSQLHKILIDYAEAEVWQLDNKLTRAAAATAKAEAAIQALNSRVTTPDGIGSQSL